VDVKTLEQALKLQDELASKLTRGLETLRTGRAAPADSLLKEKQELIAAAQAELEAAVKEREAATSHWDELVARRKATLESLQREIERADEQPGTIGRRVPKTRTKTSRARKPR
jgi:hypothetical protein